jgi:uncharacterized glyoxalase superfamily protein PhnB
MGIFESIDSQLKELAVRRKTLMALRTSVSESISASSIDTQQRGDINQRQQAASETGIKEKVVPLKKKELAAKMLQAFDGDQISWTLSIRRYTAINGRYRK